MVIASQPPTQQTPPQEEEEEEEQQQQHAKECTNANMIPRYLFCTKHLNLPPLVLHHAHLIRVLLGGKVCLWHNTTFLGRQKLGTTMAFFGETSLGAVIFCISSSIFGEFLTFLNLHCGKSRPDQRINSARTSAICTQEVPGWSVMTRSQPFRCHLTKALKPKP